MSPSLSDLMQPLLAEGGEAAHLHPGEVPVLKIGGVLHPTEDPPLEPADTEALLRSVAPDEVLRELRTSGTVRFDHRFGDTAVFEVMAFRQDGHAYLVIRRSG